MTESDKSVKTTADSLLGAGTADKLQGKATELLGRAKTSVGSLLDDENMQADGAADKAEGTVQRLLGEAKAMREKLSTAIGNAAETVSEKSAEALHMTEAAFDTVKENVMEASHEASEKAKSLVAEAKEKAHELATDAKNKFSGHSKP